MHRSAPIEMGLFGDAEVAAEQDGFADVSQDEALQQVRFAAPHILYDSIAREVPPAAFSPFPARC